MPWREPQTAPFTRIGIVSLVPSESGVFGLFSGDSCLLVAESWNLKARLLDLINTVSEPAELTIVFELCPETEAEARRNELQRDLLALPSEPVASGKRLPGISFWLHEAESDLSGESREL